MLSATGKFVLNDQTSGHTLASENIEVVHTDETSTAGPQDIVLSCLKGNQLADALPQLRPLVSKNTTFAVLQNGLPFFHNAAFSHPDLQGTALQSVDPGGRLLSAFSPAAHNLVGVVTQIAVAKTSAAEVLCTSKPGAVRFELAGVGACVQEKVAALVRVLRSASLDAHHVRPHHRSAQMLGTARRRDRCSCRVSGTWPVRTVTNQGGTATFMPRKHGCRES